MRLLEGLVAAVVPAWISLCSSAPASSTTPAAAPMSCTLDGQPLAAYEPVEPVPELTERSEPFDAAKRAYDAGDWPAAIPGLEAVATGVVPESEGNRMQAAYLWARALEQAGDATAAAAQFEAIYRSPHHAFRHKAAERACAAAGYRD